MKILITGGAGFIGAAVVRHVLRDTTWSVVNVDCLTYAAQPDRLASVQAHPRYVFEPVNVCDEVALTRVFAQHQPDAVMHLAAETHVDRSIDQAAPFFQTNVMGTQTLLEVSRRYWQGLSAERQAQFRFHQVSTDEVYGDLPPHAPPVSPGAPYAPSSPYAASKAAADHAVRAWHRTYGLPTLITLSTNTYGPTQYPEKLIPLCLTRALAGASLPIYGHGQQIRDWMYVEDQAQALVAVLQHSLRHGVVNQTIHVSAHQPRINRVVVETLVTLLDELVPLGDGASYRDQIVHIADRPGHDERYALATDWLTQTVGWQPRTTFEAGLRATVLAHLAASRVTS